MLTIPDDPLNRFWVDASSENGELATALRRTLVCFLAFDHQRLPALVGTGFVLAGTPEFALIATAKHVLTEGVLTAQFPTPVYAASALFVPQSLKTPSIRAEKLKAVWLGDASALTLNVAHAHYCENLDVALCVAMPQKGDEGIFQPITVPLDTTVPALGDSVHMISLDEMKVFETCPPEGTSRARQQIQLTRKTNIRIGTVTGNYPDGFRQYRWPCFTTSIPAKAGMSGGLVSIFRPNKTLAACGIICADNSTDEAHLDNQQCGESVIACAWSSLGLSVPNSVPSTPETPTRTLHEMMIAGDIGVAIGGTDCVVMTIVEGGLQLHRLP